MTAPNKPRDRKCATCRFYEPSPLWRKGWCRNPLLYDAQTNHLVEEDSLSCSRAFIDYWEARDPAKGEQPGRPGAPGPVRRAPSIPMTPTGPGGMPLRGGNTVAAVQAANQPRERAPKLALVRPDLLPGAGDGPPSADTRVLPLQISAPPAGSPAAAGDLTEPLGLTVLPEAVAAPPALAPPARARPRPTYATPPNRLRRGLSIAVLVAAVIAALVLTRPRATNLPVTSVPTATAVAVLPVLVPTSTPRRVVLPPPTPRPTPLPPTPGPLVLAKGANVQITGLNGSSLNVRNAPGLTTRVIGGLRPGATGHVTDGPRTVDGVVWWQITGWDSANTPGWASAKFLKPVR